MLLEDMFQSAQKIKRYTQDLDFNRFLTDDKTMDAVVRNPSYSSTINSLS